MDKYSPAVQKALAYVQLYLQENLSPAYLFHNYKHTEEVLEVAHKLGMQAKISEQDLEVLTLAACFQFVGYAISGENYEKESVAIAREFMKREQYEDLIQDSVCHLVIQNTSKNPPETILEKLLHDATWSFLGRNRFEKKEMLLRLEKENLEGGQLTANEWNKRMLKLQQKTRFYTSWAQTAYAIKQDAHIAKLRQSVQKAQEAIVRKKTGKNFGRGVDTIYRITLRNHINLSSIADGKANMVIGVNASIISALIAVGGLGLTIDGIPVDQNVTFAAPMGVLLLCSLAAIVFAIMSAIPKVSTIPFTQEDVDNHKVSMLYFGNFLQLEKEEFVDYLRDLKWDQEVLYDDLSRDLYNLGAVLKRKYELLTIAYRLFMGGMVASVCVFILSYIFFK